MEKAMTSDRVVFARSVEVPDGSVSSLDKPDRTVHVVEASRGVIEACFLLGIQMLVTLVLVASVVHAEQKLLPAGSLVQCRTGEEKISSQTEDIGDPVVCQITRSTTLPYGSLFTGQFADFRDPGHFVGKGYMELDFDRVIIGRTTVVPISAKVVNVKGYRIDNQGRILGQGHATRDIVEWMIPLLWPIDLISLPRRGPRPTLKSETQLTVKLMEDVILDVPKLAAPRNPYGFSNRSFNQDPAAATEIVPPPAEAPVYLEGVPSVSQSSNPIAVYSDGRSVGSGYPDGRAEYETTIRQYIQTHNMYGSVRRFPPVRRRSGQIHAQGRGLSAPTSPHR